MIKANELRCGNIIDVFGQCEVIAVNSDKKKVKVKRKGSLEGNYLIEWAPLSSPDVKPVQLTEDMVYKLGFHKCGCGGWMHKSKFHIHDDFSHELFKKEGNPKIETIHHLQNLHFAFSGIELSYDHH